MGPTTIPAAEWNAGLGVVTKNTGVPTTATPIIVRTSTYTNKPTGTNGFGIDFLAEGVRYYFTVDALSNQKFYRRSGSNWVEINLFSGVHTDPIFARHFTAVVAGKPQMAIEGSTNGSAHTLDVPGIDGSAMLFIRKSNDDIVGFFPNVGGGSSTIIYSINEYGLDVDSLRIDLPTGTDKTDVTLSGDDKFLLSTFDGVSLTYTVLWHDEHHTGLLSVTGLTYQTSNNAGGQISVSVSQGDQNASISINPTNATQLPI